MNLRTRTCLLSGAVLLLSGLHAQAQQMYRWVDQSGRVTYSQNPPPAGAAKNVQQRRITGRGGGSDTAGLPYAAQVAVQNFPVTLYTAPDCSEVCKNGRDMLTKRGIPFKEIVAGDEKTVDTLKKISGETRVPALVVGRQALSGFEPTSWKSALDDAGYPASIPTFGRPPAANVQRNLPQVKLYATTNCGPSCQDARDLLATRQIPFQEVLVESPESLAEMKGAVGNSEVVPALLVGSSTVVGFNADRYNTLLNNAGFQQTPAAKR